jgi:hypothetical protein
MKMKPLRICIALAASALVMSISVVPMARHANGSQVQLTKAYASVDATSAWNSVCASYEFPTTNSVPMNSTFYQAWSSRMSHTMTFEQAFAGIKAEVSGIMGTPDPGWIGDETMNTSIQNWPE